jgi:hypothetical protein
MPNWRTLVHDEQIKGGSYIDLTHLAIDASGSTTTEHSTL